MSVIETFMDEGGTHAGSPILSVAAYGGTHDQWSHFLSIWNIDGFHAKDNKWDSFKPKLAEAIQESNLEAIVTWVKPKDFKKYAGADLRSNLGNAYALCAFGCAIGIHKYAKGASNLPVSFVIEKGQPNAAYVEAVLKAMGEDDSYEIASVALAGKSDFRQLVTADFLAHSKSTGNEWFRVLYESGLVGQEQLTPAKLERISSQVSSLVKRHRNQRAKQRRQWRAKR